MQVPRFGHSMLGGTQLTMKVCPSWYARYRIQNLQGKKGIRLAEHDPLSGASHCREAHTKLSKVANLSALLTT